MRNLVRFLSILFAFLFVWGNSAANGNNSSTETTASPLRLDAVVVTGTMPGPGMWRVESGNRTLWLIGTIGALPSGIEWKAEEVDEVLSSASLVIAPPGSKAKIAAADVWKMMSLAPAARSALKLPKGTRLEDVLPAELFVQWTALKDRYVGKRRGLERFRPMFASTELYWGAVSRSGLSRGNMVWDVIAASAAQRKIPIVSAVVEFPLALDRKRYKAGISLVKEAKVDDIECFSRTLERLVPDISLMIEAANAWAVGDVEKLRSLDLGDFQAPCKVVYDSVMAFQERPEVGRHARESWLAAAEAALREEKTSLGVLRMSEMIEPGGYLDVLASMGYTIRSPDDQ